MKFITTALAYYNVVHVVWNICLREISTEEMNDLHWLLDNDAESGYCARMILLRDEGYTGSLKKVSMVLYLENMSEILTRLQKT